MTDWGTDDPGGAGQCRYPVGKARNSTRRHVKKEEEGIILIIKSTTVTNFSNLHVSESISVHHQESSTVHTAIGICHTGYADCLLASSQHNRFSVHHQESSTIYLLLCVQC